jgi:hypothetical protein
MALSGGACLTQCAGCLKYDDRWFAAAILEIKATYPLGVCQDPFDTSMVSMQYGTLIHLAHQTARGWPGDLSRWTSMSSVDWTSRSWLPIENMKPEGVRVWFETKFSLMAVPTVVRHSLPEGFCREIQSWELRAKAAGFTRAGLCSTNAPLPLCNSGVCARREGLHSQPHPVPWVVNRASPPAKCFGNFCAQ